MATVPAHDGLAVSIGKAVRDRLSVSGGGLTILSTHAEIADVVTEHLASPNCRDLLTRFVAELHAEELEHRRGH